jgi:endoglucanase
MHARPALLLVLMLAACLRPQGGARSAAANGVPGEAHNLLANGRFDGARSVPWTASFTDPGRGDSAVSEGAYCVRIDDAGKNRWDAQLRHRDMVIQRGHAYMLRFKAWASAPTAVRPKVGMAGPPYAEYWADTVQLDSEPRVFEGSFMMKERDDATAELAFHLGGELASRAPLSVCIDDVLLADPEFEREPEAQLRAVPALLVNQVGYLPKRSKVATLVSDSETPLPWQLLAGEKVAASGNTEPLGADRASGKRVHRVDFTRVSEPGDAYVLSVGDQTSHPFAIRADLYDKLKVDALAYFYHNRSGIEIALPHAREAQWARPAGHLSDRSVPCAPGSGCRYSLDVAGGWYDAGDHGKYVVNGGISVWTLLDQYERLTHVSKSAARFGDGTLSIPERKNGVPDLLDEARWELSFLLRMQVPDGQPLSGMVHHKIHDAAWTALPLRPDQDDQKRYLYPPSTAATLNLAAVAAQAARVFEPFDAPFARACLKAAQRAYRAAQAHPDLFAKPGGVGGGPYDDDHLGDEQYWAAAELLITTGDATYRDAVVRSPYFRRVTAEGSAMSWQSTESLGTISLALVSSVLGGAEREAARKAVIGAAERYLEVARTQGFRQPLAPDAEGRYPWGSNSSVLNNMVVLALAHDFSGEARFADAVVAGMDYLLGNNPLDQSYVTGYGARPLQNPHHRFWARQLDASYPPPPPGAVSGGPNSGLEDPYARGYGLGGCAPATCFVDHIESYSTNEITINWNAPLAWVAAYLDELGQRGL